MSIEVLIVEDDAAIRESLQDYLELFGFRVSTAVDGLDALDRLRESRPQAILLDLMMPRMSGLEFLTRLREDPVHADLPVIVMSANADTYGHRLCDLVAAVFRKPLDMDQLILAISSALPVEQKPMGEVAGGRC